MVEMHCSSFSQHVSFPIATEDRFLGIHLSQLQTAILSKCSCVWHSLRIDSCSHASVSSQFLTHFGARIVLFNLSFFDFISFGLQVCILRSDEGK